MRKLEVNFLPPPRLTIGEGVAVACALVICAFAVLDALSMHRRTQDARAEVEVAEGKLAAALREAKSAENSGVEAASPELTDAWKKLDYDWTLVFASVPDVSKYDGLRIKSFAHSQVDANSVIEMEAESLPSALKLLEDLEHRDAGHWQLLEHKSVDVGGRRSIQVRAQWSTDPG